MEKTIFNSCNLTDAEIDEVVTRVKVFIMNEKNQLLLASYGGVLQLPGGHVEGNEEFKLAVLREIKEETGIELDTSEVVEPFYEVHKYSRNHRGTTKNRLSKMVYYFVKTNKTPDINNINLTEDERNNNFFIEAINYNEFKPKLLAVVNSYPEGINRSIAEETLIAFDYLNNYLVK